MPPSQGAEPGCYPGKELCGCSTDYTIGHGRRMIYVPLFSAGGPGGFQTLTANLSRTRQRTCFFLYARTASAIYVLRNEAPRCNHTTTWNAVVLADSPSALMPLACGLPYQARAMLKLLSLATIVVVPEAKVARICTPTFWLAPPV